MVAKDVIGGNLNSYEVAIAVPRMDGEKLSASNIVLADMIEHVPTKSIGMGQFVIGTSKVRPRVDDIFKRDEKMGIYFKIYNFGHGWRKPHTGRRSLLRGHQERHQREDFRDYRGCCQDSGRLRQPGNS